MSSKILSLDETINLKFEKFDSSSFKRWKFQMTFWLTTLGLMSALEIPTTPSSSDANQNSTPAAFDSVDSDVEFEDGNKRKDARRSASTRRTRAAEVHNLSERRRRDRINEKMKALQKLIPRCYKSDKASMLDDAIEYLKSLQSQVQMMSMGCNMGQMMFPDNERYLSPMGMGMYMGMGMTSGADIDAGGLRHPMLPLGSVLPCPPIAGPAPAHLLPPLTPSFHSPNIAIVDQQRVQSSNQQDPALNSINMHSPNMVQIPNVAYPYHHYVGRHHLQVPSQV